MEGDLITWMKGLGIMGFIAMIIVWDARQNRKERKTREKEQNDERSRDTTPAE